MDPKRTLCHPIKPLPFISLARPNLSFPTLRHRRKFINIHYYEWNTEYLSCWIDLWFVFNRRNASHKPGNDGNPVENGIPQQPLFNNQGFPPANMGIPQGGIPQDVLSLHQLYVEQMTAYMNNWYMYVNNKVPNPCYFLSVIFYNDYLDILICILFRYQGALGGMFYQYPQPPVGNFVPPAAAPFQPQNINAVPPNRAAGGLIYQC